MPESLLLKAVTSYLRAQQYVEIARDNRSDPGVVQERLAAAKEELERSIAEAKAKPASGFDRILVALGSRPEDARATDVVLRLARDSTSRVGLVHVVDTTTNCFPEAGVPTQGQLEHEFAVGAQLLSTAKHRFPMGLTVDEFIREGYPPDQVTELAKDWHADVIVVGTRGGGRLMHFLRGSTAEAIIQRARCPVLVVDYHTKIDSGSETTTSVDQTVNDDAEVSLESHRPVGN
jgi:nucleotide-binding universal stress UspA family protein